jgi:hypothetical protein
MKNMQAAVWKLVLPRFSFLDSFQAQLYHLVGAKTLLLEFYICSLMV